MAYFKYRWLKKREEETTVKITESEEKAIWFALSKTIDTCILSPGEKRRISKIRDKFSRWHKIPKEVLEEGEIDNP